jgi:hypothetical protein
MAKALGGMGTRKLVVLFSPAQKTNDNKGLSTDLWQDQKGKLDLRCDLRSLLSCEVVSLMNQLHDWRSRAGRGDHPCVCVCVRARVYVYDTS